MKFLKILAISLPIFCFGQIKIPKGYNIVKESPANGKEMGLQKKDFDGDKIPDSFVIVKNDADRAEYQFIGFLSKNKKQFTIPLCNDAGLGIYPYPMKFNGKILELNYMQEGTAHYTRIFKLRFNEKVQKIQIIGFDSEYRYNVRATVKKSFNLLTGNFIDEKFTTDFNEKLTTEKAVGINKNFKNLFLKNLDCGTVFKLDEIGTDRF